MKIAYLISAHTDPRHMFRLIDALQPHAEFFIHVDAKVDISLFAACERERERKKMCISSKKDTIYIGVKYHRFIIKRHCYEPRSIREKLSTDCS